EMADDRVGHAGADHRLELLAAGPTDARHRPERGQQLTPPARADAVDIVELRPQVPLLPRLPKERDGEPVGLVANPLQQPQRRALARQRDAVNPIAREDQLLLLRKT